MKKKTTVMESVLFFLAAAQFLLIIYFNYAKAYGALGMDSALALRHAVEMWKNGIFLDNFTYFSTLEIDCIGFFAAPIYAVTKNLGLSMSVCHAIGYVGMAAVLYDIAKNVNASRSQFLLMVLLVFSPYSVGGLDWASMIFISVAQYGFRVMVLLLLFDLMLICSQEKINKVKLISVLAVFSAMNFWTSLSAGNYVLCTIILPILIGYVLSCIQQHKFKLFSWSNAVLLFSILVSYAGYKVRLHYVGASYRNSMSIISASQLAENIEAAVVGVLQLFGGIVTSGGISVFSEAGIAILLKFVFVVFCSIVVIKELCRDRLQSNLSVYFLAVFLVDFGILLLTDTRYGSDTFEHRYHILWGVMFLLVAGYALMGKISWGNPVMNKCVTIAATAAIVLINVLGFRSMQTMDSNNENKGFEKTIIATAEKENVESIFIYDRIETAAMVRAVVCSVELDKYCASVSYNNGYMQMSPYDYYVHYFDNSNSGNANIMMCPPSTFAALPEFVQNTYTLVDDHTFGSGMYVYRAEKSVWDGISGLPLPGESKSIDFPYSSGYAYNGTIDETGCLLADAKESGFVLWGPSTAAVPGTYNITVVYKVQEVGDGEPFFDIAANSGQTVVIREKMPNDAESYTLQNVEISGTPVLEFRVWKPAGSVMQIEKIIFERVE